MSVSFISALIRFKIMPLTIVSLSLLFCIKLYDVVTGTSQLSQALIAGEAIAVTPEDVASQPTPVADEATKQAAATTENEEKEQPKPDIVSAPPPAQEKNKLSDTEYLNSQEAKQKFSQIELDILQSLAARREQITKWEEEVRTKENLLEATELRIGKRIDEIKNLEKNVRVLLEQYEKQDDAQIRSLVKIYENMKPKDAAQIFNELEMPVLLIVADRMAERKAAPILAQMDPKKAKDLTVELAEQRKMLNDTKQALDAGAVQ